MIIPLTYEKYIQEKDKHLYNIRLEKNLRSQEQARVDFEKLRKEKEDQEDREAREARNLILGDQNPYGVDDPEYQRFERNRNQLLMETNQEL